MSQYEYALQFSGSTVVNVTQLVDLCLSCIYSVSGLQVHWCTIYRCIKGPSLVVILWHDGQSVYVCVQFYFVFDVLPYLLYCNITYCLYNIVSGHPVLLLLKIDWLIDWCRNMTVNGDMLACPLSVCPIISSPFLARLHGPLNFQISYALWLTRSLQHRYRQQREGDFSNAVPMLALSKVCEGTRLLLHRVWRLINK